MSFKIGVIGTGYVGLVSGTCFAATGNDVYCIDIVEEKINKLKKGIPPIYEPGLDILLQRNLKEDRLHFSMDLEDAVVNCQIIFLCLPTPPSEDGSADLHHVKDVVNDICMIIKKNNITEKRIIVNKSTVPVGTVDKISQIVKTLIPGHDVEVASNPEFLREGFAVEDGMKPERVVIGTSSKYVEEVMRVLYEPFVRSGNPIYFVDVKSAEVIKYAANSFLAVKISFMNDLSAYCEAVGADIEKVRFGMGSDSRIGKRFLFAGIGYGGSCFPKDVRALIFSAEAAGTPLELIEAAQNVNSKQIERFIAKILKRFNNDVKGMKFAIWGLSFKPDTDDVREAKAFTIIEKLLECGASVKVYDPEAMDNTRLKFGDKITYAKDMYECASDADSLIIATEWNVFRTPDFNRLNTTMKKQIIFDGRNLYNLDEMEKTGFEYYCVGRRKVGK